MRFLCLLAVILLPSCTGWNRPAGPTQEGTPRAFTKPNPQTTASPSNDSVLLPSDVIPPVKVEEVTAQKAQLSAPATPRIELAVRRSRPRGIACTFLTFDDRTHTLLVADKNNGPDSEWKSSQSAATAHGAIAGINGGFFTPQGKPLGLVIENGARHGTWSAGSSLTSGVMAVSKGRPQIVRREVWASKHRADYLLQSGPFLLENAAVVSGLSSRNDRARSFVAWDGDHHWTIGYAKSATLSELAAALATQPLPGMTLRTALNLDGGSSSDLWVSPSVKGGPVSARQFWSKPVRNYLLVTKISSTHR